MYIYRKTSILNRFLFKKFEAKHRPTVEDLFTKEFDLGSIEIKVRLRRRTAPKKHAEKMTAHEGLLSSLQGPVAPHARD